MISVIIPTFNRGDLIERSIKSVLNQTYKDIELIVVDDKSNDNTEEVVSKILDTRLKYVKLKENKGACFARNYGVSISKGNYIAFQDSDDVWTPRKLEKQIEYLERKKLDIVACRLRILRGDKTSIFPKNSNLNLNIDQCYFQNLISTQTIIGKRECFINVKFDERLPRFQDWDLVLNLLKKYKLEIIDEPLVDVYPQEDSISRSSHKAINALEVFIEKHSINNSVEAHYMRLIGVYKLESNQEYLPYFKKAFLKCPLNKKIFIDFILSIFKFRRLHYELYRRKGRFK